MAVNDRRASTSFLNVHSCSALRTRLLSGASSAALLVAPPVAAAVFLGTLALTLSWPASEAWAQQCTATGTNQTCTNSITLTGGATGIDDGATLTVTNTGDGITTGVISGTTNGIRVTTAVNVIDNSGTIKGTNAGSTGISAVIGSGIATVSNNSGTITGDTFGILANSVTVNANTGTIEAAGANGRAIRTITGDATVTNGDGTSTIQANSAGGIAISATNGTVTVTNGSGTISGDTAAISAATVKVNANAGTISSTNGTAIGATTDATVTNSNKIQSTNDTAISAGNATVNNLIGGNITGGAFGISATTLDVTNAAGATISGGTAGIEGTGGTVTNAGTITGVTQGVSFFGPGSSLVNSGTISQTDTGTADDSAVLLHSGGTVTNQVGAKINGALNGILAQGPTTIDNFGSIKATDSAGAGVAGNVSALTNRTGGKISSAGNGVNLTSIGATVVNQQGATIENTGLSSGGVTGSGVVMNGALTNAGTISALGNSAQPATAVQFVGGGTNTLTLQTGSQLIGDAKGSTTAGATNNLVLEGSGIANNNFVGFNSLDVQQGSDWKLSGSADVGLATVNGALTVRSTGSLTGDVTVQGGGLLGGSGRINGNVNVLGAGRVGPDLSSAGTPLTVTGRVGFLTGSTFIVLASPTAAGKLAVDTATLGGATVQVLAQSGIYAPSKQYTILTATNGFGNSRFGPVTTNLPFLSPTLGYDTANTTVTLTLACIGGINCSGSGGGTGGGAGSGTGGGAGAASAGFATAAQTQNQNAIATALNGGGVSNSLFTALLNQPSADAARQAFDALSGEVFGSVQNAQANEAGFARGGMLGRMRQMSYAGAPGELGALGFAGPQLAYASADANAGLPVKAAPGARQPSPDLTFWAQGLGGWGHVDSDGNAASLKSRFGGFLSGVDGRLGDTWRAGLVAGYLRSDLKVDARLSSAGIDSAQLGAYAGGRVGAFNVRGGASISFDSIDTSRSIAFPGFTDQTKASFHGNVGQVFGEVGYGMALDRVAVEPFAGLAYVHVHDNSFLESGGAAALAGASTKENVGYSTLGLRAATAVPLANGTVLVPRGSVQWQYAFGDVTPAAALAFQGTGTGFSVAGLPIARNTALVEGGFDWRFTPWAKLGAFYQGELAAHAQAHAIKGAFTWDF